MELGARIAELEKGMWAFITPGGQSAIALIYLAFASLETVQNMRLTLVMPLTFLSSAFVPTQTME